VRRRPSGQAASRSPSGTCSIDLAKGVELQPGEERTLSLPGDAAPGTYRVICDLPGHVEEGMVGTLEVRSS
jgi:uncharacterized cupredoxin-like copper-binding protein